MDGPCVLAFFWHSNTAGGGTEVRLSLVFFSVALAWLGCGADELVAKDISRSRSSGDGKDGPLAVLTGDRVINNCYVIKEVRGGTDLVLDGWREPARRRLLLWQVQAAFARSGDGAPLDVQHPPGDAGRSEIALALGARLERGEWIVSVERSTSTAFSSVGSQRRAQACALPEYTDVTVASGAQLKAEAWNGSSGGILGFFAKGSVSVDGRLSADASGFRGGRPRQALDVADAAELDTTGGRGGGKGEGLDGRSWALSGRGNLANGGGGGNASHSGGGGGGHRGEGGLGGRQYWMPGQKESAVLTSGLPGASIAAPLSDRMIMGGGGGSGHFGHPGGPLCRRLGVELSAGGAGGGVVFVFAARLDGAGVFSANGGAGECSDINGSGGGGAAGRIEIWARAGLWKGLTAVVGGDGADNFEVGARAGPGGGGGGGYLLLSGVNGDAPISVAGGKPGTHVDPAKPLLGPDTWGATAGQPGAVDFRPKF